MHIESAAITGQDYDAYRMCRRSMDLWDVSFHSSLCSQVFHLQMAQKEPIELHGYMWLGAASQRPKFQPAGNDSVHAPEYFRGKANVRLDLNDPMRTTTDLTFEFRVNFYFLLKHVDIPKCRFDIPKFVRDFIFTDARLKVLLFWNSQAPHRCLMHRSWSSSVVSEILVRL